MSAAPDFLKTSPAPAKETVRTGSSVSNGANGHAAPQLSVIPVEAQNLSYIEGLYEAFLSAPESVSGEWQEYFRRLNAATGGNPDANWFRRPAGTESSVSSPVELEAAILQERVDRLIRNYRAMGHYASQIDPLGQPRPRVKELELEELGFAAHDLDRHCSTFASSGPNVRTVREIVEWLRNTYCRSIGVQFMHIDDLSVREWLQTRMEATENRTQLTLDERKRILQRLTEAVVFEEYILKKWQDAKSFSLEGAETLIPLLDLALQKAAADGTEEVILGMAHRGRLNVLTSIMGKQPRAIFREFHDSDPLLNIGRGDVKYHMGYSNDWYGPNNRKVHLSLCFNPSHLEFVNAVAMGRTRAKQDKHQDVERSRAMCMLIHGDAAFAGEGIIQETLNLSELAATRIGGTIHVVVNNQIGFTTGPAQARSTSYATDVAKMLQIPIFHVNGEDPEAVAQVVRLALDFRNAFHRDVVIDMYCFRRRGHNEQDEPRYTQPLMYQFIDKHESVGERYVQHLDKMGGVSADDRQKFADAYKSRLDAEFSIASDSEYQHNWDVLSGVWTGYQGEKEASCPDVDTGVPAEKIQDWLNRAVSVPASFTPNDKLSRLVLAARKEMAAGNKPLDWGAGEMAAFASLLMQGHPIRLHGQDCERGTFSHRHAVLHDTRTGAAHIPLQHLEAGQATFEVHNSMLSEAGVLGYEYGYSLDSPGALVCWEAQFGDFANVAQVIIDQFITSAEDKWNRLSGLVLLLPHGFEGQGPEHSSARLERFLNLCAEDNIQVCYPTTSAQQFHLLRRQVLKKWRKPLVVMTPKSLLRDAKAASPLADFTSGSFRRVLVDPANPAPSDVKHVLLCSGKVFFDLDEKRKKTGRNDVAILRMEQLYPLPINELQAALGVYRPGIPVTWVQEEPSNMGAWWFMLAHFGQSLFGRHPFDVVARPSSASPATGSKKSHYIEQKDLLESAFVERG